MAKPTATAKSKLLTIKVTEADRARWHAQASAEKLTLADLVRRQMGATKLVGRAPKQRQRRIQPADPAVIAMLGRLNSNINQLARWANTHKAAADAAQVVTVLASIDRYLSEFRPTVPEAPDAD